MYPVKRMEGTTLSAGLAKGVVVVMEYELQRKNAFEFSVQMLGASP
jgi:hypothetical protein